MQSRDWAAIKDHWIQRQLAGERVTWAQLAREHGLKAETTRAAARRYRWGAELEARRRDLSRAAFEQLEIDHVAERHRLLGVRNRLLALGEAVADRLERRVEDPSWKPSVRDLASIVSLVERLTVTGAGLPKEHRVEHDGHDDVVANRRQLREMEHKVRELREWARVHRRGPYADRQPEDTTVVEAIPAMSKERDSESAGASAR